MTANGWPSSIGLEPPRHARHRADARRRASSSSISSRMPGGDHAEHVLDVEPSPQRRLDRRSPPARNRLPVRPRPSRPSGRISAASVSPKVTSGARRDSTSSSASRRPCSSPTLTAAGGGCGAGEQPALRLEVVLHRPVQVEVVLREVREDEGVEADAVEPLQRRAVRRRLDGDAPVAGVEHLAEEPLQVDRLGSRVRRGPGDAADDPLDGADEPRRAARRRRARIAGGTCVVVLPFVPVTPTTSSERGRLAEERVRGDAIGARASSTSSCGTSSSSGRSTTRAAAPAATACGGEVVPVRARPGDAEEDGARARRGRRRRRGR